MHLPEAWVEQAEKITAEPGIVLVIGRSNAGKSTLIRFLTEAASQRGLGAWVIDADLGQASFGPPTCMSLTVWPGKGPPVLRFIGSTSPAGRLPQVIVGIKLLVDRAVVQGARLVLADTSGMVQGHQGILLKQCKVEMIRPRYLLVLQKGTELERLLKTLPSLAGMEIVRLPVSEQMRVRPAPERSLYRQRQFAAHFQSAELRSVSRPWSEVGLSGPEPAPGRLVGLLNCAGETLGLGVVRRCFSGGLELFTPVSKTEQIRFLQVSTVHFGEGWTELPS